MGGLSYLRPDISKGITTTQPFPHQRAFSPLIYDLTYQKGLRQEWPLYTAGTEQYLIYDLTYQKGLRRTRFYYFIKINLNLSTTWHIKRDYDSRALINSFAWTILIYDLTYQKGLRQTPHLSSSRRDQSYLRPDISKGITTRGSARAGILPRFLSTTWHIKRDYDSSEWQSPEY